ncbi:E3 ubiquitin-protein ligase cblA [Mycena sanguinolenta]|uniref:E3 ubiquitin-protein ligase cblA n=1 Tax=Mycena sanguinolenta TaxID=230812 RepID=A0A8H7D3W5_9AGAR|nr:E3 ubiquitin-protein ligase cblA [Mycena sanguinolenta]
MDSLAHPRLELCGPSFSHPPRPALLSFRGSPPERIHPSETQPQANISRPDGPQGPRRGHESPELPLHPPSTPRTPDHPRHHATVTGPRPPASPRRRLAPSIRPSPPPLPLQTIVSPALAGSLGDENEVGRHLRSIPSSAPPPRNIVSSSPQGRTHIHSTSISPPPPQASTPPHPLSVSSLSPRIPPHPPADDPTLTNDLVILPFSVLEELQRAGQPTSEPDPGRRGLCVVCQDEEAIMVAIDCGHLAMCRECSNEVMSRLGSCPICRTRIVQGRLIRVFKT